MKFRIEFYRTRDFDDAHAVLDRVTREASDLDDATEIAQSLLHTLEMPQWPDAMIISDIDGKELYRRAINHRIEGNLLPEGELFTPKEGDRHG